MRTSRRDFLKIAGGVLGGVVLAQYGGCSSGSSDPPLPSGYRFYRVFTTGDPLPDIGEAIYLPPSVKISDSNQILFHAGDGLNRQDNGLNMGLYELVMDYGSEAPKVEGRYKVVRVGDRLPDGKEVFQVSLADVNKHGSAAVRLHNKGEASHSLYLERSRSNGFSAGGLQRVVGFNTPTPDGQDIFGASLGNFDLHEGNDILVTSFWGSKKGAVGGESLFHLPGGRVSPQGSRLLTTGEMLPNSAEAINKFGLLHGSRPGGEYTVQVYTEPVGTGLQAVDPEKGFAVLKGRTGGAKAAISLVAASPDIAARAAMKALPAGKIHFGPRINEDGEVAVVTHVTEDVVELTVGENVIARTGDRTPSGRTLSGVGGPVMCGGLVFFVAGAADGTQELLVSNGSRTASLLATGMRPFGAAGPTLLTLAFGYVREQADREARLVFVGEFDDNTLSVVLGIPL